MKPLTERQQGIYDWLLAFLLENHRFATTHEVARAFGGKNRTSGYQMLRPLAKKGWLEETSNATGTQVRYRFAGVTLMADRTEGDWPDGA